jgi:hypothetical protein
MKIEQYENTDGVPMILVIDEEANQARSMTKEYWDSLNVDSEGNK